MANQNKKRSSIPSVIWKIQIEATKYHYTSTRTSKILKDYHANCGDIVK